MFEDDLCISELWLLADYISVIDAALLMVDIEPQGTSQYVENWDDDKKPLGYVAASTAIVSCVGSKALKGYLHEAVERDRLGNVNSEPFFDFASSTVEVESLRKWLGSKGYTNCFFFRTEKRSGFRDPAHPRYAPKLAAAVEAWESFDDQEITPGTPKQRIEKWLRLNAPRFGLVNDEGKINETAIGELGKICNWQTKGGAPKAMSFALDVEVTKPDLDEIPF